MANTHAGFLLTDANRRWQALLGATAAGNALELAGLIDPADIPGTMEPWLEQMIAQAGVTHQAGVDHARAYVEGFRVAEWGADAAGLPVVSPVFDPGQAVNDVIWAPRLAQAGINTGVDPVEAWATVVRRLVGAVWGQRCDPAVTL